MGGRFKGEIKMHISVNIKKMEERRLGQIVEKYLDKLEKLTDTERRVLIACIELYAYPKYLVGLKEKMKC